MKDIYRYLWLMVGCAIFIFGLVAIPDIRYYSLIPILIGYLIARWNLHIIIHYL